MTLIDAHVHVWDTRVGSYAWLDGTILERPMLPAEYARGGEQATGAIFVQAADDGSDPIAEARWVAGLDWPELVGIVAAADLGRSSADVVAQLDGLAAIGKLVGVRQLLQDMPTDRFSTIADALRIVASRGLTFDACIRHGQLRALIALLESAPELTVVLDHLGKPPVDEGMESVAGSAWASALTDLAARPRTYVKLSGLTAESQNPEAFNRHVDAFLEHALTAFGPERAMIASDWPVSTTFGVAGSFAEWVARVRRLVPEASWPAVSTQTAARAYLPSSGIPAS